MDAIKSMISTRPMKIMLISIGILFGLIFGFQFIKGLLFKRFMSQNSAVPVTVSTIEATYQTWQPIIKAAASLRAIYGVDITTEISGIVKTIYFKQGSTVNENDLLVLLNSDSEIALLHSYEAALELSKINYNRNKGLYEIKGVSKAQLDTDAADLKSKEAQVNQQTAIIAKKTIRAPFAGRLGISNVNPGQYVNAGDKIVTLQSLDPIYADFYIPQQEIRNIALGQVVKMMVDAYPNETFIGEVTTIDPKVDATTRNIQVEATLSNANFLLFPGMFSRVNVLAGCEKKYLTVPQSAISYNPYGDIVYIVKETGKDKNNPTLIAVQKFVKVGESRGDQIAILSGVQEGDIVVTSGQLKLRNKSPIIINNSIMPTNDPNPQPVDQ